MPKAGHLERSRKLRNAFQAFIVSDYRSRSFPGEPLLHASVALDPGGCMKKQAFAASSYANRAPIAAEPMHLLALAQPLRTDHAARRCQTLQTSSAAPKTWPHCGAAVLRAY